jgi:phage-related minor tail protein
MTDFKDPDSVIEPVHLNIVTTEQFQQLQDNLVEMGKYLGGLANELGLLLKRVKELDNRITGLADELDELAGDVDALTLDVDTAFSAEDW